MKKLFYLLFLLPLAVACGENNNGGDALAKEPVLKLLSEDTMTFDAQGGEGMITYELVKGTEAQNNNTEITDQVSPITITVGEDWIEINEGASVTGIIKFRVAENTTSEARTAKIYAQYYTKTFSVTIEQAAKVATPVVEGWAVVGSMTNNWDASAAIKMESVEGYFVARGVAVEAADSFKFVKDGDMSNALGGNGQPAERDYKYPISKYGSDIRVKEAGTYDLYINEALNTYYVMSEGKNPVDAQEVLAPGEDVWYVVGLNAECRMQRSGIYMLASKVALDEDGFMLRNSILGECGAVTEDTKELDTEIAISTESKNNIVVNYEEGKLYDIYVKAEAMKVWVVPAGVRPDILNECFAGEGAWFTANKNFYLYLEADGIKITVDCTLATSATDRIIPETTFVVANGEDRDGINYIDSSGSQIANEYGKTGVVGGEVTVKHVEEGYDISVELINHLQHKIRAHYVGTLSSNGVVGSPIATPSK